MVGNATHAPFDDAVRQVVGALWADSQIVNNVATFCDECGNRFAGTPSELAGRDYLVDRFRAIGLEHVRLEPCVYTGWQRGSCRFELLAPRQRSLEAVSMVHSPSTVPQGLAGELICVNQGTKEDFDRLRDQISGKIALVWLGSPVGTFIHRVSKYGWAKERGAAGVIFAKEEPLQLLGTGTVAAAYREVGTLPAVGISYETGRFLMRQLAAGSVSVRLTLQNQFVPNAETWNIVGDIPGETASDEYVLIGGHWDGHDRADAALDNALGLFTAFEAARALGKLRGRLRRSIRLVAFGNEESWIVGSTNYVAQHAGQLDQVALMINCDALARFGRTSIRVSKRADVLAYVTRLVAAHRLPIPVTFSGWLPGSSDEWPFLVEGVPAIAARGTLESAERSRGRGLDHTQADTVDKVDDIRAREASMLLAQLVIAVANEAARPAPKLTRAEMFNRLRSDGADEELRVQGRWHPESIR